MGTAAFSDADNAYMLQSLGLKYSASKLSEILRELSIANKTLSDKVTRRQYDRARDSMEAAVSVLGAKRKKEKAAFDGTEELKMCKQKAESLHKDAKTLASGAFNEEF